MQFQYQNNGKHVHAVSCQYSVHISVAYDHNTVDEKTFVDSLTMYRENLWFC